MRFQRIRLTAAAYAPSAYTARLWGERVARNPRTKAFQRLISPEGATERIAKAVQ